MIADPITRKQFYGMVPTTGTLLEIGPYARPTFHKPDYNVFYADILTPEEIKAVCANHGYNPALVPDHIDILIKAEVRPTFITDMRFDAIFSSHNMEHHPDLINHLVEMEHIAKDNHTCFFVAIPDKRYCFDHWQNETSFVDIISAHCEDRRRLTNSCLMMNEIFGAHNKEAEHWHGRHGNNPWHQPLTEEWITKIQTVIDRYKNNDKYVDGHAWKFTPFGFAQCMRTLKELKLQNWVIDQIYDTYPGSNEFYAILKLKQ